MAGEGVTEGLLRDVARELLRRDNLEDDVIRDAASRLAGLVARLRAFGEELLADMPPAMAFDPGHPAYRMAPGLNAADLERLGVAGGTGYGATVPERGDPDEAGAPGGSPGQRSRGSQSQPDGTESWAAPAGRALASDELAGLTAGELVDAFRAGRLGVVEVTRAVLERIERYEPSLRAFVTVLADRALATAERRERELAELRRHGEEPPPLFGVPVALKDLIDVEGVPTTAGSRVLAGHVAARNATVTERLERAGAVIIGKTATHEFAFGATTDTPFHGPVHNPWNLGHSAGGSSGGSGAAVGAGIVPVAMGTDTGGSIRIPAAACGTVGLKPSYGRVSRDGTIPLSWSLDHTGPLAVTVADAARVLEVIAGPDPLDPAAVNVPATGLLAAAREGAERGLEGIRVGVLGRWARDRIHPEVAEAFQRAVEVLAALGARVEEVEDDAFPPPGVPALVNRVLALAEGGAYHAATLARQAE
ncbi:MAG TPA: amidase, partial [Thermaerobacter sp.]